MKHRFAIRIASADAQALDAQVERFEQIILAESADEARLWFGRDQWRAMWGVVINWEVDADEASADFARNAFERIIEELRVPEDSFAYARLEDASAKTTQILDSFEFRGPRRMRLPKLSIEALIEGMAAAYRDRDNVRVRCTGDNSRMGVSIIYDRTDWEAAGDTLRDRSVTREVEVEIANGLDRIEGDEFAQLIREALARTPVLL